MSRPILETVGVVKQFRTKTRRGWRVSRSLVTAVDGVDLTVSRGETLGVVGESGSGKTTLSRMLLDLERPTAGEVRFDGTPLPSLDKATRRRYRQAVQPVFQNPFSSLNPRMRVRRIVGEPLRVGGTSRQETARRVDRALEMVGLTSTDGAKFPQEFSGGQRQRIAIARALASDPALMILDEAVSSQDISIRAQILNLLKDLQNDLGVSYLFIAHDLATVRYLCDRVAVMYRGRIVETGDSDSIYDRPRHDYTRSLLNACLPDDPDLARQVTAESEPTTIEARA